MVPFLSTNGRNSQKGQSIADEIGCRGHRGRARSAIDQRDLAEIIAGTERGELDALARDLGFARIDEEEGGGARAFHDDGFALGEAALFQELGDLLGLPAIHVGEEIDALERGHRIMPRRYGRRRLALAFAGGDRAALQEIERSILDRPFDIAARPIDFLALRARVRPSAARCDLVEAKLVHLLGRTCCSNVPPLGSEQMAMRLRPALRSSTWPARSRRK